MLKGVHLTLMMGPVVAVPVPRPVIEALASAEVTVTAGQRSGFQLRFTLGKNSLLSRTLLPAGFFDPGIRVILTATVGGIPDVLMDGIITRQDVSPSSEPGQSTLTVTGEDLTLLMDLLDAQWMLFPAMPAFARVAMIIGKYAAYGMLPMVVPELFPNVAAPVQSIPIQQGTDLAYIEELAQRNGYTFYLEPGPAPGASIAYFGPEIRVGVPEPALSLNMDAHTNVESLSFSYDGLSATQPVLMMQIPQTKMAVPIPVPDISPLRPPLAMRPATRLRTTVLGSTAKLSVSEVMALGISEAARSADAITGTGTLNVLRYGRLLHARRLVSVRGAGVAYDGLYYVTSVSHSIRPGEYRQSFTLARGGLISLTQEVPV